MTTRWWSHPLVLLAGGEAGYLLFLHAVASAPHSVALIGFLPLGGWTLSDPEAEAAFYAACVSLLFAGYAALLGRLTSRQESRADALLVFGGAALFGATLLFQPALLSKDLFDYMGHGRVLSLHGSNPYTTTAADLGHDPFTSAMGWSDATSLYGPVWVTLSALLTMGGGGVRSTALLFKLFFLAIHLLNGLLVMKVARGWPAAGPRPARPLRAAAFYLWNPLVLMQSVGDAHNDGVVLFWLLLGLWLLQRGDDLMGTATLAMSVMVKYVTAPIALLVFLHRLRQDGMRRAAFVAGVGLSVGLLAYLPYLSGFSAGQLLRPYEHSSYQGGLLMLVEMILGQVIPGANAPGSPLARALLWVSVLAAGLLLAWYVRACLRTRTLMEATENGTRMLLYYLLAATALLRTSYLVWLVGLAAVIASVPLRRAVAIFSFSVLSLEVLWVWRLLLPQPAGSISAARFAASAVAVGVPILYLLLRFRGWTARSRAREVTV